MKPLLDRPLASFPYDPRKTWSFMFMLGVLVLLGLLRIVQNGVAGEWGIIFMLIVIPGLAMIMVGSELRLRGPILIIAEDGLVDRRKGPDGVRWEDVQEATIKRRILSRGIRIELTNGERYDIEHHPNFIGEPTLFIHTNADGAEDFKIVTAPLSSPGRERWRDLIPHRQGVLQLGIQLLRHWLVRLEREDGLPRIVVRSLKDGTEHSIAFAEEAYSLGMVGGYEFDTDELRFSYSSMTTPTEVWDYDMAGRRRELRKPPRRPRNQS